MMFLRHKTPLSEEEAGSKRTVKSAFRRAFTITELVIVIAVVAILAAVLIPTFANIIDKANESADTQTVKNLNTILEANETLGDRADTVEEALAQALEGGYKVENLTPTSDGYDIVWDAANNRFALIDKDGNKIFGDPATPDNVAGTGCWQFSENYSDVSDDNYLWYMSPEAQLPVDGSGNLNVSTSINLSAFPELESVTVPADASGKIDITLNSDQTNLLIEGTDAEPNDATINLYGKAGVIGSNNNSTPWFGNYGMNSLHIYGNVGKILVKSGKVVAHSGSTIRQVAVQAEILNDFQGTLKFPTDFSIEKEQGATISEFYLTYDQVGYVYDRNNSISDVLTNKNNADGSVTYIYDGIMRIDRFMLEGYGTKEEPFLITSATDLRRMGMISPVNSSATYFKLANDIVMDAFAVSVSNQIVLDLNDHSIIDNEGARNISLFSIKNGGSLTINGNGQILAEKENSVGILFTVGENTTLKSEGTLIINGGSYIAKGVARADKGTITINGGEFRYTVEYNNTSFMFNYLDASYASNAAKIIIYGGTFVNFDPAHLNTEQEEISLVADGYISTATSITGSSDVEYVVSKAA